MQSSVTYLAVTYWYIRDIYHVLFTFYIFTALQEKHWPFQCLMIKAASTLKTKKHSWLPKTVPICYYLLSNKTKVNIESVSARGTK